MTFIHQDPRTWGNQLGRKKGTHPAGAMPRASLPLHTHCKDNGVRWCAFLVCQICHQHTHTRHVIFVSTILAWVIYVSERITGENRLATTAFLHVRIVNILPFSRDKKILTMRMTAKDSRAGRMMAVGSVAVWNRKELRQTPRECDEWDLWWGL